MSCKELRRAGVLARVKSGELTLVDAAVLMGVSYRQSKRLAKRYREGGTQGLKHGSADDVEVNAQTLRRWMLAEGLWSRARKRRLHRKRRERKEHAGELVQMDGSFHPWLEERGPRGC
jgi:hypothetical protein